MKAGYIENGQIKVIERPRPVLGPGLARIQVLLAGICRTDVELLHGYYGFAGVPGHEFMGLVREAPGRPELLGRRVVAEINIGCGDCPACQAGRETHCHHRRVIGIKHWDGCLAEELLAPVANLRLVPPEIGDEEAVFTEPLAAVRHIADQVRLNPQTRLAIIGDGNLGVLAALALKSICPELYLLGRHAERLALASAQEVKTVLVDRQEKIVELTGHLGLFDVTVDATGRPDGINWALALTRPEGTVVVKTTSALPSTINLAGLVVHEQTLVGSRCGAFGPALELLSRKALDVRPLISEVYPLDELPTAMARAQGPGKVLVRP